MLQYSVVMLKLLSWSKWFPYKAGAASFLYLLRLHMLEVCAYFCLSLHMIYYIVCTCKVMLFILTFCWHNITVFNWDVIAWQKTTSDHRGLTLKSCLFWESTILVNVFEFIYLWSHFTSLNIYSPDRWGSSKIRRVDLLVLWAKTNFYLL